VDVKIYDRAIWLCPVSEAKETLNFSSASIAVLAMISDEKVVQNYF
jgi:hypothetical protein